MAPKLGLVMHTGVEGFWRFNASGSSVTDLSGNAHTLTLTGSSSVVDGSFANARGVGPGAAGAGNTNYFSSVIDAAANSRMLGETTYEAWIYAPAVGITVAIAYIPGFGTAGGDSLGLMAVDNGYLYGGNGASFAFTTLARVPVDRWAHIALRKRIVAGDGYLDYFISGRKVQTEGPFTIPVLGTANRKFWLGTNGKHWATVTGGRLGEVAAYAVALTDEEIFESYRRGVGFYTMASQAEHMRAQVKDSGGTWRDLTSYPGFNAVKSASWRADLDDPLASATVTLKRELEGFSLAPLMETSAANLAFNPAGSYAPLLDGGREVKIDVAVVPTDIVPVAADWVTRFHGIIDIVDSASSDVYVLLQCRDLGAALVENHIEEERFYSLAVDGGPVSFRVFQPSTPYALGEYVIPTDPKRNGTTPDNTHFYEVTVAGTSGAEPAWPTSAGSVASGATFTFVGLTTDAGTQLELILQCILDDNDTGVTLFYDRTADWAVKGFIQQREPVLSALRALATQNGWDIRYKWNDGTQGFELTLFEPERGQVFNNYSFGAGDYKTISRSAMDITRVRNTCKVIYSDPADLEADGETPKRKSESYTDASSEARFERRFMEIAESDSSNIDTSAEALRLATACILDLKDPLVDLDVQTALGFPWAEIGHMYGFEPNSRHFSVAQSVAVASWSQSADNGRLITRLTLRGKPAGRYSTWQQLSVHPAAKPGRPLSGPQSGTAGPMGAWSKIPDVKNTRQNVAPPVITPLGTLPNSWVASQGTVPGIYRSAEGRVYLEGAIEGGVTSPTLEFATLPYAPQVTQLFVVACNAPSWPQLALILIDTDGKAYVLEGDPTYIYLNQISYRTDI